MHTSIRHPEYFFWAALVCLFLLVLRVPNIGTGEAAAAAAFPVSVENPYDALLLAARAAYVLDTATGEALFAKDELEPLPLASVAKIMTAVTALSSVPETTYVTITEDAIGEEGDSGLQIGERWLLQDLLAFTLLESSNDGAAAVSSAIGGVLATTTGDEKGYREIFIEEMNALGSTVGLSSARFWNETGLDIPEESQSYTARPGAVASAADSARLLAFALKKYPRLFTETRWDEILLKTEGGAEYVAYSTNKGVNAIPLLIASKTGYTDLAGGNLVVAFDAGFNHPVIIAVLGSTEEGRFSDVEKLVWSTLEYLRTH